LQTMTIQEKRNKLIAIAIRLENISNEMRKLKKEIIDHELTRNPNVSTFDIRADSGDRLTMKLTAGGERFQTEGKEKLKKKYSIPADFWNNQIMTAIKPSWRAGRIAYFSK